MGTSNATGGARMEWQGTWEDPFTTYLTHFDGLIGDARTRITFAETVKGIIAAGSLVCQRIAAQSPVFAAVRNGAQCILSMGTGAHQPEPHAFTHVGCSS